MVFFFCQNSAAVFVDFDPLCDNQLAAPGKTFSHLLVNRRSGFFYGSISDSPA
jgi:hypothetical protein